MPAIVMRSQRHSLALAAAAMGVFGSPLLPMLEPRQPSPRAYWRPEPKKKRNPKRRAQKAQRAARKATRAAKKGRKA